MQNKKRVFRINLLSLPLMTLKGVSVKLPFGFKLKRFLQNIFWLDFWKFNLKCYQDESRSIYEKHLTIYFLFFVFHIQYK